MPRLAGQATGEGGRAGGDGRPSLLRQVVGAIGVVLAGLGPAHAAITLDWAQVAPFAVFAEELSSSTITIKAKVSGGAARVVANYFGNWFSSGPGLFETVELYDDGTHGDAIAGDGVFTGRFVFSGSVPRLRRYGGQLDHLPISVAARDREGNAVPFSNNVDGTLELGLVARSNRVAPVRLTDRVMAADSAVNIVDADIYRIREFSRPMRTFYSVFPDAFDGVAMFTGGRTVDIGTPGGGAIRNAVSGIGMQPFDHSAVYGTQGRLKYLVLMNNNINGQEFLHEFGHSFGIYLNRPELDLAASGGYGYHWGTSDLVGQMRGGYYLERNPDGTFLVTNANGESNYAHNGFADLELYLMGLLPPEQVGPRRFVTSAALPAFGSSIPASATQLVTIDDIVRVYGRREPAPGAAQREFSFAFIVVTDEFVGEAELALVNTLARYYASGVAGGTLVGGGLFPVPDPPSFAAATKFRGSMKTTIDLSTAVTASAPGALSGLWWNPGESGWGISFTQRRNLIFAAWYAYDDAGNPKWYVASRCEMSSASVTGTCSGPLYEASGPAFFVPHFDPTAVKLATVGSLQVAFHDANTATMAYTLNGQSRVVDIARNVFRTGTAAPTVDYTDLWWNPGESGWGMSVTQQSGVMFLAWYVYDSAGKPVWYVASNCEVSGAGCSGTLYRTTGPPAGPAFDPGRVQVIDAGTVSLRFSDANNGTLTYTVNGVSASKNIVRNLF